MEVVGTLIYDGECGFCTNAAKWARNRLPAGHGIARSQDFDDAQLRAMGLTRADVDRAAWWIEEGRAPAEGADAIARSLVAMGGRQAVIGRVVVLPLVRVLARRAYRWVAENRATTSRWMDRLSKRSRSAA